MEVPFYLSKLLFELNEQRKRDFFCDCSILVEGRVFKAHRNVLFAGSGYFRALLVHYLQVRILASVLGEAGDVGHCVLEIILQFYVIVLLMSSVKSKQYLRRQHFTSYPSDLT